VRALAHAGARVVICARDLVKAEEVANDVKQTSGNNQVEWEKLELDSLTSVNAFVARYLAKGRDLNILINNAGIMACPLAYTVDGFESQFGTNHMGHFALVYGLLQALKDGAKRVGKNSRVVCLTSIGHLYSDIVYGDINFKSRAYDSWSAYGQSKTANSLLAVAITKLFANEGIIGNTAMPGGILTGLQKHMTKEEQIKRGWMDKDGNVNPEFKNLEQGAATSIWAAVAPELENVGGKYLENCAVSKPRSSVEELRREKWGYFEYAVNEENAVRLWNVSEELLRNPPK
jgi:NAD(P)-dependent dehydrogenase (short-subunit alcohol dehydrogenase family)